VCIETQKHVPPACRVLPRGPSRREILDPRDLGVDDRTVTHGRTDELISLAHELAQQLRERLDAEHVSWARWSIAHPCSAAS